MLKRTRGREPGLFPELATEAAMWRPGRCLGQRGEGRRAPARVGVGPGGCGGAACGGGQQEVACGLPEQRGREEEDDSWIYLQFQKSLGVLL